MFILTGIVGVVLFYYVVLTPLVWFLTEGLDMMGWKTRVVFFFLVAVVIRGIYRDWDKLNLSPGGF